MFWKEIYRWIWILYTRTNCVTLKNLRYYTNWTRLMLTVALPVLALIFFNTKIFMGIRCTMILQFFHFSLFYVFQMKNKAFLVWALFISRRLNFQECFSLFSKIIFLRTLIFEWASGLDSIQCNLQSHYLYIGWVCQIQNQKQIQTTIWWWDEQASWHGHFQTCFLDIGVKLLIWS